MYKTSLRIFVTGFNKKIHTKTSYSYEQRHPIIMTDADYILDKIERREKIEFQRNVSVNSDKE